VTYKQCSWCLEYFDPKVSYQIYCGADCRELATKEKIKERSRMATIKRRQKKKRVCANGCGTVLSIYNDEKVCSLCKVHNRMVESVLDDIAKMFKSGDV